MIYRYRLDPYQAVHLTPEEFARYARDDLIDFIPQWSVAPECPWLHRPQEPQPTPPAPPRGPRLHKTRRD